MPEPLSRADAERLGLVFIEEGVRAPSDPDQEIFLADLTIDGHTEHIQSKSEEGVLDQVTRVLVSRGRIRRDGDGWSF